MSTDRVGWRPGARLLTPTRITAAIAVGLLALTVIPVGEHGGEGLLGYLGLVLLTAVVLRGVRREPGRWLGDRVVRRLVVVLIAADCVALAASPAPTSGYGATPVLALFFILVVLNIALGRATRRIAAAPDAIVDERQEALRNRAHRIAYAILAVLVGGTVVVADTVSAQSREWLSGSLTGGGLVAFLELLFVLPAMVLAFLEPGRRADDDVSLGAAGGRARVALALLVLTVAVPVVLSLAVVVLPLQSSSSVNASFVQDATEAGPSPPAGAAPPNAAPVHCREFQADVVVGRGVSADVPLHAVACWDGRQASAQWGMNKSDCHPNDTVLTVVATARCTTNTSRDGTLTFIYTGNVASALTPFLSRDVTVQLTIDRNGNVEHFP